MRSRFEVTCLFSLMVVGLLLFSSKTFAQQKLFALHNSKWPYTNISVSWDNPEEWNKEYRELVRKSVEDTWERHSGVKFTCWGATSAQKGDIRIRIYNDEPLVSALGRKLKNPSEGMKLNFKFERWSPSCQSTREKCIRAQAVHEFGHALGLAHEQNRTDCPFKGCYHGPPGEMGDWTLSPCDEKSVMNSCNADWNNDGQLSEEDIKAIKLIYPKMSFNKFAKPQTVLAWNAFSLDEKGNLSWVKKYFFRLFISDEQLAINRIENVTYTIDEKNLRVRSIMVKNLTDNFAIGFEGISDAKVTATIHYKNGRVMKLNTSLKPIM